MNNDTEDIILAQARGPWQRDILYAAAHNGRATVGLSGKARQYKARYDHSLRTLNDRLRTIGWQLEIIPGPRGGTSISDPGREARLVPIDQRER